MCHVVSLSGVSLKLAKSVITALGCSVGKLTTAASTTVPKGDVISISPKSGTVAANTKIAIVSSSGKPKKPSKKKKKVKH
jgi:beta-lactam-binding protein with PASTA domain